MKNNFNYHKINGITYKIANNKWLLTEWVREKAIAFYSDDFESTKTRSAIEAARKRVIEKALIASNKYFRSKYSASEWKEQAVKTIIEDKLLKHELYHYEDLLDFYNQMFVIEHLYGDIDGKEYKVPLKWFGKQYLIEKLQNALLDKFIKLLFPKLIDSGNAFDIDKLSEATLTLLTNEARSVVKNQFIDFLKREYDKNDIFEMSNYLKHEVFNTHKLWYLIDLNRKLYSEDKEFASFRDTLNKSYKYHRDIPTFVTE